MATSFELALSIVIVRIFFNSHSSKHFSTALPISSPEWPAIGQKLIILL